MTTTIMAEKQNTGISGFSEVEKQNILDKHNALRRLPNAANMCLMEWDADLEAKAQGWADTCNAFDNPDNTLSSNGAAVGENIHTRTDVYNEIAAVQDWYDERANIIFPFNVCAPGKICIHYQQVVWATSMKIGCGIKFCPTATSSADSNLYIIVCNYEPQGNTVGQQPYIEGAACSQCPADKQQCDNGLCAGEGTTTSSTTTSTSKTTTTSTTTSQTTTSTTTVTTTPTTTSTTTTTPTTASTTTTQTTTSPTTMTTTTPTTTTTTPSTTTSTTTTTSPTTTTSTTTTTSPTTTSPTSMLEKRDTGISGFSEVEKQNILDKHNALRRLPNAANMCLMEWDTDLEAKAQGWADTCNAFDNPDKTLSSTGAAVGENIHTRTDVYNEIAAVQDWYDERANIIFPFNVCAPGKICIHYQQVVWATSMKIGCGIKFCPTASSSADPNIYIIVCNYEPQGNTVGQQPYIEGAACSQCPADKQQCDNGLCADEIQTTNTETSTTTTTTTETTTTTISTTTTTMATTTDSGESQVPTVTVLILMTFITTFFQV